MPQLLELLDLRDKLVTTEAIRGSGRTGGLQLGRLKIISLPCRRRSQRPLLRRWPLSPRPLRFMSRMRKDTGAKNTGRSGYCQREAICPPLRVWLGVLTVVMITRVVGCEATGVGGTEVSSFLRSLRPNARHIGRAIRGHWSIENGCAGCSMWCFGKLPGGSMIVWQ